MAGPVQGGTHQGVFGITRTTLAPAGKADSRLSMVSPAAMETTRWRSSRCGASAFRMPFMKTGFTCVRDSGRGSAGSNRGAQHLEVKCERLSGWGV